MYRSNRGYSGVVDCCLGGDGLVFSVPLNHVCQDQKLIAKTSKTPSFCTTFSQAQLKGRNDGKRTEGTARILGRN